jgi:hypothetical protein
VPKGCAIYTLVGVNYRFQHTWQPGTTWPRVKFDEILTFDPVTPMTYDLDPTFFYPRTVYTYIIVIIPVSSRGLYILTIFIIPVFGGLYLLYHLIKACLIVGLNYFYIPDLILSSLIEAVKCH